ncbi:MAG: efflux RND transporter periplasmic adaptor subunit [Proteobacteria bacterium]|nr:efflux RND transporter periplasmic adaptor subunit [Pseudomonadota bacterium]
MIGRLPLLIVGLAAGAAAASLIPGLSQSVRTAAGFVSGLGFAQPQQKEPAASQEQRNPGALVEKPAIVKLTEDQITAAHIDLAAVQGGTLAHRITVPGTIVPDADRIARVSVKLSGTVAELRKRLGDLVAKDEVLAVLESREIADAKSDYLAARLTSELQQDLFERDKALWEKRISNEQQFLRSRNAAAQTRMRLDIARQKLLALGLNEQEIAALPDEPEASLRRQEVRSPLAGRVVERKIDLGTAVGRDNLETELFMIVDLDRVWVELAISPGDLPAIKEGQTATITARGIADKVGGKIVFISPLLDKETRSARVVAEIANSDGVWRPGSFVTAALAIGEQSVRLVVPKSAIQTIGGEQVVFVRTREGFEKRLVVVGRSDEHVAEIMTGLQAGEIVAVTNVFLLKAELTKGLAED